MIGFEVSDRATYERKYITPEWPKGQSGITIGIGYDIGYHTETEVRQHWAGLLAASDVEKLCEGVGLKGTMAQQALSRFQGIRVPWDTALEAYRRSIMPKYGGMVLKAYPEAQQLHGHCFGALFSLVFNRGARMTDSRPADRDREEMRNIQRLLRDGSPERVVEQIRAMKRLWADKGLPGLLKRRDAEAALFERGLALMPRPVAVAAAGAGQLETIALPAGGQSAFDPANIDGDGAFYEEDGEQVLEAAPNPNWAKVVWPVDDNTAPDYHHIVDRSLAGSAFELDARALDLLIRANVFEPTKENGAIVFALRGAELVTSVTAPSAMPRQEDRQSLTLRDIRPNHRDFKCVIGVYNVATRRLSGYASSTVPNPKAVASFVESKKAGNMMTSGCYSFEIGWHLRGEPTRKIPGCLIENGRQKAVLRSTNNHSYDTQDTWENHRLHGDNLHPAKSEASASFSSWGCLVVNGNYKADGASRENGEHTGEWGRFRRALGLTRPGTGDHERRYDVVLLTGLEAAIASALVRDGHDADAVTVQQHLGRLRQGSRGERVKRLQKGLGLNQTGVLDHVATKALADRQKAELQRGDGIYSPAMDQHFRFDVFAPLVVASRSRAAGGALESLAGAQESAAATAESNAQLEGLYYEIGLLSSARQRGGGNGELALESLSGAQLEFSFASLKEFGLSIANKLERELHALVCGQGGPPPAVDGISIKAKIDDAAARGSSEVRRYLISLLTAATFVPPSLAEKVVDVVLVRVLGPIITNTGAVILDGINLSASTLCNAWSERLGIAAKPPEMIAPPGMAQALPLAAPLPPTGDDAKSKIEKLVDQIEQAAKGDNTDPSGMRLLARDLARLLDEPGEQINDTLAKRVIGALTGSVIDNLRSVSGQDVYATIADLQAELKKRPLPKVRIDELLGAIHGMLANARVVVQPAPMKQVLKELRSARLYNELSQLADRFATRDPRVFCAVAVSYAQGLVDSGRLIAALEILNSALDTGEMTTEEAAEAQGLRGRVHKQVYVNYVKTSSDAVALRSVYGTHLVSAIDCYMSQYDPAKPGDEYWHGINYIALLHRAKQDRIEIKDAADANELARNMIAALEPKAATENDAWVLATIGEAYLTLGNYDKAAEYLALYAKHTKVDAFALNGTIRQLEQVWRLTAEPNGPGAIVTGLKAALADMEGGTIRLSAQERRALIAAPVDAKFEHQMVFEAKVAGGRAINFYTLKRIVQCGTAVTAIQKRTGNLRTTVGTGFLVKGSDFGFNDDKSYVLTNAHVVWDQTQGGFETHAIMPGQAAIIFENDVIDGKEVVYECEVVWQSPSSRHDATLLALKTKVTNVTALEIALGNTPLIVASGPAGGSGGGTPGTRLAVLGHPGGGSLAVSTLGSLDETQATLVDKGPRGNEADPVFLHYETPTEPGNSGSPVFETESWKVVALHHAGFVGEGMNKLGGKQGKNLANEGIHIESILKAAREAALELARKVAAEQKRSRPRWLGGRS